MNTLDMSPTIVPKSDQLNADDLIGGRTLTIKITKVTIHAGEQPVALHYEGDNGKPYKPGKSMARVLVFNWGADANQYIGRSLTLYRDDTVKFGGIVVGGIRISHMSHISEPHTMALTATRGSRRPFTVKPLVIAGNASLDASIEAIGRAATLENLKSLHDEAVRAFKSDEDRKKIIAAKDKRKKELTTTEGEPTNDDTK